MDAKAVFGTSSQQAGHEFEAGGARDCLNSLIAGTFRFGRYLATQQIISIATLGPEGTSSAEAARALSQCVPGGVHCGLFPTYEDAANEVVLGHFDYLVVANAFSGINRFYISDQLIAVGVFPWETPPYGVAVAPGRAIKTPELDLASHPAPLHLADHWFRHSDCMARPITMRSTSEAASSVANGTVPACITTDVARRRHGLAFVTRTKRIPMLWSVFARQDHATAQSLFRRCDDE